MRPIDADALYQTEKLLDTNINRRDKVASELLEQILYDIQHFPTLAPQNEWVSVDERLPQNNEQVLMYSAKWNIAEAGSYWNKHFWVYSEIGDGYIAENITHWMPLPAPPNRRPPERQEDTDA